MFKIDPIYIIVYTMMILTAAVLLIDKAARRPHGRPASRAEPTGGSWPPTRLRLACAAVAALTQDERQCLRVWMDEGWPSDSSVDGSTRMPGRKTRDERITQ